MTIDELLRSSRRRDFAAMPESDALTEEDALLEAGLLDIRFSLAEARIDPLFDLRVAWQFRVSDAAVLVLREMSQVDVVSPEPPNYPRFAPPVMRSTPGIEGNHFTFYLGCLDGSEMRATSAAAEFFVGDIPGLPEAQPDFVEDDDETIVAGMPAWSSVFKPEWATFIDPAPPA